MFFTRNHHTHIWLQRASPAVFVFFCGLASFITYTSMYAFRKPFTAATFTGLHLWGLDYKIVLIILQLFGYTISKFLGIKIVAELPAYKRIPFLLKLMGMAWISLLLFALIPVPYNAPCLFLNGLPLGMIWGVVFSFLEGRRFTELLGAFMASSFIVASGIVKAGGLVVMSGLGVSEEWMPFVTGLFFLPFLLLGIWMLAQIPSPSTVDLALRTLRKPMNGYQRKRFFRKFAPAMILSVIIYLALTIFRDMRDNFAVEIWTQLGYQQAPGILVFSELTIAFFVLILIGSMILIKKNRNALFTALLMIFISGLLLVSMTLFFHLKFVGPVFWMIMMGFALYLPYITFHTIFFERWIAYFRFRGNIGYLMYVVDAVGYLGSMLVLLYKNLGEKSISWLTFFTRSSYQVGVLLFILSLLLVIYFKRKEKKLAKTPFSYNLTES